MSEFERFFDNPESDFERGLLEAGRKSLADQRLRTETLAVLGITGTAAFGAAFATTAWKKLIAIGVVGSVGIGSAVTYYQVTRVGLPETTPAIVEPVSVPATAGIAKLAPKAETTVESTAPRQAVSRAEKAEPPQARSGGSSAQIRDEVRALDGARSALAGGDPNLALSRLSGYEARFPKGALRMEAAALRVRALSEAGRKAEASRQASRLVQKDPNGVLASRLRRYVQP